MIKLKFASALLVLSLVLLSIGCGGTDDTAKSTDAPVSDQTEEKVAGVVTLTKDNFGTEVLKSDKVVLVDFWADWCGPCMSLAPIIEEIALENPHIKVGKINIDEQADLAEEFNIMSIPTLKVFKDGKVVNTHIGYTSKENILRFIDVE